MTCRGGWALLWILTFLAASAGLAASGLLAPSAVAQGPGPGAPPGTPPGPPPATASGQADSEWAKYVTTSMNLALVESPDHSTVWAYIGDTGRWAKLSLRPSAGDLPKTVKMEYAIVETEDAIHGFSKQAGTWSTLERKPGVKFAWIKREENVAVASMGSWIYAFSPKVGTWTSVDLLAP